MDAQMTKTVKYFKFYGKKIEINKGNVRAVMVTLGVSATVFVILNYWALGAAVEYFTGIPTWAGGLGLLVIGMSMTKLYESSPVKKRLNDIMWRLFTLGGIYWVIQYSDWSTFQIGLLILATIAMLGISKEGIKEHVHVKYTE